MKLVAILNVQSTLNALANEKLPARVAYAVGKTINAVMPLTQEFEMTRMTLLQQLGTVNQEQQKFDLTDEANVDFNQKMMAVVEKEVDVKIHCFTLADLGDTKVEPRQLTALEEFGMLVETIVNSN